MNIQYWDRKQKTLRQEKIFSEKSFRFLYENPFGYFLTQKFLVKPWFSRLYGNYYSRPASVQKIDDFVNDYEIQIEDFENRDYQSFNDFFSRKFKNGARSFAKDLLPSICEGRVLAFENIKEKSEIPVKRQLWPVEELLGEKPSFELGSCFIFRLNPSDYHRFHFPDDGSLVSSRTLEGRLDSVNPLSLARNDKVFVRNRRTVFELETKNFGPMICVAVAGLCVGRIIQSFEGTTFKRGEGLGYFEFGGSTIVLIGKKGAWKPSPDLLEKTARGTETYIRLGEKIGSN